MAIHHLISSASATAGTTTPSLPTPVSASTGTAATGNIYSALSATPSWAEPILIAGTAAALIAAVMLLYFRSHHGNHPHHAEAPAGSADAPRAISFRRKAAGIILFAAGIAMIIIGAYAKSGASRTAPTFSSHAMLSSIWTSYKATFLVAAGTAPSSSANLARTIDPSTGNTTSEGESYTMLRAVWMDDQPTFDASWQWTQTNLQRPDRLFSWLYGSRPDGSYGVLTAQGGQNTASDADSDIALALVFAYSRWQEPQYLTAARQVIAGIWNNDVVTAGGRPYLAADNLEKSSPSPVAAIDPSYFSPYEYRIFAAIDPSHPWQSLVDDSYSLISASMTSTLDTPTTADLPPDWIGIDKATGAVAPLATSTADTNYGFDAMRLPWRLALDWQWNHDPRDQAILNTMGFLKGEWTSKGAIDAVYAHNGAPVGEYETPAAYGGDIGYFLVSDPADAAAVYGNKLLVLYDPGADDWKIPLGYYDANWAWFGIALYTEQLPNLAASLPASSFSPSTAATGTASETSGGGIQ